MSNLTTDQFLTFLGLLKQMTTEHVLTTLSNNLLIQADDAAQDGRFEDEKAFQLESNIVESAISKIREIKRNVLG